MTHKKCSKCKEVKSIGEFSPRAERPGQFRPGCKKCSSKAVMKRYYDDLNVSREKMRIRAKNYAPSTEINLRTAAEYRKKFPERAKATYTLTNAVRDGKIERQPCFICGEEKAQGHHFSYAPDMYLAVTWLCRDHHMQAHHKEMRGL